MNSSDKTPVSARIVRLQAEIRRAPEDVEHRAAYFQLLCVQGVWEKAADQLALIEKLDPTSVLYTQAYRRALQSEIERERVHAGPDDPVIFGEPADWMGALLDAFRLARDRQWASAARAQAAAFEKAPETTGTIDGEKFAWVADGDSRFGPMLEAFVEGHYRWIPFMRLKRLEIETPTHLVDTVWSPAKLKWTNGGQVDGLIPTRYFGTESSVDGILRGARGVAWTECADSYFLGVGARQFVWDTGDKLLPEVRILEFT